MIIAVDFDGVCCKTAWPGVGKQKLIHKAILWYVKMRQKKGDIIILNTCREDEELDTALSFLKEKGLVPDYANENARHLIAKYGDCRKISADIYIDDHNAGMLGWLLRKASK